MTSEIQSDNPSSGNYLPPSSGGSMRRTFSALSIPAYRLLLGSMVFNFLGMQMQQVARGVLAYEIGGTNSAIAIVSLGWGIPMLLFGLLGGTVADKFEKRKLLMVSQCCMAALAIAVAILVNADQMNLLLLFISGLVQGVIFSFSGPARQAFIPEVVGQKQIMNAIALNQSGMNLSRIAGPSLAGALIAVPWVDIEGVFLLQALLNAGGLIFLLFLPRIPRAAKSEALAAETPESAAPSRWQRQRNGSIKRVLTEMMEGLAYVKASPILLTLLLMGLVPTLLGMSYQTFLPVFAKDVFGDGVNRNGQGLGLMMTMTGIGALIGSLAVATLADYPRRALLQLFAGLGFGLSLVFFSLQSSFAMALLGLTAVGFCSSFFQALNSTMVMSASDSRYYGRVMSINMMSFGLMPIGTLPIGFTADYIGDWTSGPVDLIGIQAALIGAGLIIVGFICLITLRNPSYGRLQQDDFKRFADEAVQRLEGDRREASRVPALSARD